MMREKPEDKTFKWVRVSVIVVIVCLVIGISLVSKSVIEDCGFGFDIHEFQISRAAGYLEKGKIEETARLVAKLEKTVPPENLSDLQNVQMNLAREYVKTGDLEKAEGMRGKLAKAGYGYKSELGFEGFGYEYELGFEGFGYEYELGFLEASILKAGGRYSEAIEVFEKIEAATFCGNGSAEISNRKRVGKAECHEQLGNYKDAYIEYLLCIPNMSLSMTVEPMLGMRRLRPILSESEKKEVDKKALGIMLRFLRDTSNREIVLHTREVRPEDWPLSDEDRACYGYLYEEAERFGLMSAFERAEKKLEAGHAQ